jgi:hypothetical protein
MSALAQIKATQSAIGRSPPHSKEAEEYLLSCCFIDGNEVVAKCDDMGLAPEAFYVPANRLIYERITDLYKRGVIIELAVVAEDLKTKGNLDQIGGYPYMIQVSQSIPTTAQAPLFIEKIIELHRLRELIKAASTSVENAYNFDGDFDGIISSLRTQIDGFKKSSVKPRSIASFGVPPETDDSVLLGNRYLNRGDGALFVSTSGMGKSSSSIQAAVTWGVGQPFFGIKPNGPLRSLIVQAEDSDGDVGEVWVSVAASLNLTPKETELASKNVTIVTERVRRGSAFIAALRGWVRDLKPDLVWINPLLAFIDGDVNDAKDTGKFLREGLNGLNEPPTFAYIVIHHTTKPPSGKDKKAGRAWNEIMYDMAGSADLTNWARAIISLRPTPTQGEFELVLAKRGRRAGVTREVEHGMGTRLETVTTIPLKHAEGTIPVPGRSRPMPRIFWEYREPSEEVSPAPQKGGRPKTYSFAQFADVIPADASQGLGFNAMFRKAATACGISKGAFDELIREAKAIGLVAQDPSTARYFRPSNDTK